MVPAGALSEIWARRAARRPGRGKTSASIIWIGESSRGLGFRKKSQVRAEWLEMVVGLGAVDKVVERVRLERISASLI
jgi:hypothetical protein